MKKKIVFVISRGEVIRNFVYSEVLSNLRESYEIHLVSVVPNESLKNYLIGNSDSFTELIETRNPYYARLLHELIDLAHNRYLWSEAAKVRWKMRDYEAKSVKAKCIRLSKKYISRLFANSMALSWLETLDFQLSKNNSSVKKYLNLLRSLQPVLVFNGSHLHGKSAYGVIQAARILNIKTSAFLFSWDNLTSQGRIIPPYNYYMAWNENIREDLIRIYPNIKPTNIYVTGTPQFIFHFDAKYHITRNKFLKKIGLKANDKYVMYSAGMSHHMPFEHEIVELLADMLLSIDSNLKLVVRTYAKDRGAGFQFIKHQRSNILIPEVNWERNHATPLIEDQYFYTNLLRHCELGINVASTVSLELCMLDKPAINIGFDPPGRNISPYSYKRFYAFDHYRPIINSGAIRLAKNPEELLEQIKKYLSNKNLDSVKRKELIHSFFADNLDKSVVEQFSKVMSQILIFDGA